MATKESAKGEKSTKTFTFETVAVLLASMEQQGFTLGGKQYQIMSALDGSRTYDSFQHEFRAVKKRASELGAEIDAGKELTPAKKRKAPATKSVAAKKDVPSSRPSKKRARELEMQAEVKEEAVDNGQEEEGAPGPKKAKTFDDWNFGNEFPDEEGSHLREFDWPAYDEYK